VLTQTCLLDIVRGSTAVVEMIMTPATGLAQSASDMRRSASRPRGIGAKARLALAVPACGDAWVSVLHVHG
jgi:hypothetical protein